MAFGGKDLPRPLPPPHPPLVSLWKRAKRFSRDQGRAQTPNGTGDPREWRPSQTNRIPVSIPLRRRRRLRRELPSAQTLSTSLLLPRLPLFVPPFLSRVRLHPSYSTEILSPAGRRRRGRFTVSDVTTLFSRFNRDPDYVVRQRFSRRSSIWRFKSVLFCGEEIRKYDSPFTAIFLIFLSSISRRFFYMYL